MQLSSAVSRPVRIRMVGLVVVVAAVVEPAAWGLAIVVVIASKDLSLSEALVDITVYREVDVMFASIVVGLAEVTAAYGVQRDFLGDSCNSRRIVIFVCGGYKNLIDTGVRLIVRFVWKNGSVGG